jgi:Family of unknown function (DUF6492)
MTSIGLVTPTYWRDLELCALLCESVDRHVTNYEKHYLIVADADLPLFAKFNGPRRTVLSSLQFLPKWLRPIPRFIRPKNRRRYWWSFRTMPVSGWHVQQLLKIGAASAIPEERCCILDSDNVFFRKFDVAGLARPNPVPLFHVPRDVSADAPLHAPWVKSTFRMLGLGEPTFPATDFVGHVIVWDQRTIRALTKHIEKVTGREWAEALCRARHISEYMLYGYFVQNNPEYLADHVLSSKQLCVSYWDAQALDGQAIDKMLNSAEASQVAFSAPSFSGTSIELIRSSMGKYLQMQK